ncbi:hypothetical protein D9M68_830250 [compost metagenome]
MVEALGCAPWVAARFGENKGALDDSLSMEREAFSRKIVGGTILFYGCFYISHKRFGVSRNAFPACFLNYRAGPVSFLRHCADKTSEFWQRALDQFLAKRDISKNAIQRIGGFMIRSCSK